MYVYMCVCMYVCMYVSMYLYMYVCVCIMYMCVYVLRICVCVCMYVCIYVGMCIIFAELSGPSSNASGAYTGKFESRLLHDNVKRSWLIFVITSKHIRSQCIIQATITSLRIICG
jgi:hypothetical protein